VLVYSKIFDKRNLSIEEIRGRKIYRRITQTLKHIRVLDYVIVGHARQNYFSFARAGVA
jgi:DNA repair protein RadC